MESLTGLFWSLDRLPLVKRGRSLSELGYVKVIILFQTSSYCRGEPIFTLAEPSDLQIVCGEHSVQSPEPEITSPEHERVLDILEIINHPDYKPNEAPGVGGPIEGNDLAVYKVMDSQFRMSK